MIQRYRICNTDLCTGENVEWRTCHEVTPCIASWADWTSWSSCSGEFFFVLLNNNAKIIINFFYYRKEERKFDYK